MPVPFGFSVRDCISVCILIKDVVRALDSTRGSSSEYQEVIRELWALDRALLEVANLAQSFETTIELNALSHATRRAAEQCKTCIEGFLEKVKRYEIALREGGSGNMVRDVKGKVGWALCHREHLQRFRTEINGHSSAINMLLITASVSLTKLNDHKLQERMESTNRADQEAAEKQSGLLGQIKDTLDEHLKVLQTQGITATRLAERIKFFFALGSELKTFMVRIWTLNFRNYKILLDLQTRVPREFEPCWIQEAVRFTDALGRVAPIHLELVNSWDVLESVLTARFKNVPGRRKVEVGEYALQDRVSLRDIERSQPFEANFLPGRKIDMSMVFNTGQPSGNSCPGCNVESESERTAATLCSGCGMWYQRIEEIVHLDSQPRATPPRLPKTGEGFPQRVSQKRKLETSIAEDTLSCFKRVRLLQRKYDRGVERDGADWDNVDEDDTDEDDADWDSTVYSILDDEYWDDAELRREMARIRDENKELRLQNGLQFSQNRSLIRQIQELQTMLIARAKFGLQGRCHSCNRLTSLFWRRGPDGEGTLCVACGRNYDRLTRKNTMEQHPSLRQPQETSLRRETVEID